jgi:RNA polymerase sigma factor (sigma-70 family)
MEAEAGPGGGRLFRFADVQQMNWDETKDKELAAIIERFSGYIRAGIQRYNPRKFGIEIDDVLQDVKIKIWKILRHEKKIANYSSYIKKIVDTSVIDQFRRLKREEGVYLFERNRRIAESEQGAPGASLYAEMDLKDLVGKAVDGLIDSRRRVVKLYLLNMSIEEISLYFNWSKDKTRNLLYRGLNDLKKILKEKNIDYDHED